MDADAFCRGLIKSPKLYFSDTGLLCYLLGLDAPSLLRSPYLGSVWETAVFAELRKKREREGARTTLWFYRDAQQREVDFVIAKGETRTLLEAKWTENPEPRDAQWLAPVGTLLTERGKSPVVHRAIVCRTPHPSVMADGTRLIDLAGLSHLDLGVPGPRQD